MKIPITTAMKPSPAHSAAPISAVMKITAMLPFLLLSATVSAADIELPKPETSGGMPLMEALQNRRTDRKFSSKPLPRQILSNLLWAASGVNRADGRMTAPTARNLQEISLYVLLPSGIFRYDAPANRLVRISAENITGQVTGKAPLTVVYVADLKKQPKRELCAVDCGYISQNIYLYCASAGLGTVVRGSFDRSFVGKLKLPAGSEVFYIQSVGYPK